MGNSAICFGLMALNSAENSELVLKVAKPLFASKTE
jgi:hypothetical protein